MNWLVEKLGGRYVLFHSFNMEKEDAIKRAVPFGAELEIRRLLGVGCTTANRYDMEYRGGLYQSYKPGIDDNLQDLLGCNVSRATVIEIGGGPSYIAEHGGVGVCCDLVKHPRLDKAGVVYVEGDICHEKAVDDCLNLIRDNGHTPVITVLSYCLDRVSDQRKAIQNFATLVKRTRGLGLITVCLPALSSSPGVTGLRYGTRDEWVTRGEYALVDYQLIVEASKAEGLKFTAGGLTTHYGVSLDGYESLPCYVMVFTST